MPDDNTTCRVLQITDPHLFSDPRGEHRGQNTLATLNAVLAHARDGARFDAVLVTGDTVQDETRAGYRLFKTCFEGWQVPVLCLPGNHDDPGIMAEELQDFPFHFCGVHQFGNWVIVMMDTHLSGKASGHLSESDLRALDHALACHGDCHVMVCMHHHPVRLGSKWLDTVGLRNPDDLHRVLDAHNHVRAVVWGHVHQAYSYRHKNRHYYATPSTCSQFVPGSDDFGIDVLPPGYRWLELASDGTLKTEVVWLDPRYAPAEK